MSDSTEMQDPSKPAPSVPDQGESAYGALGTLTRLLVGGALLAADVLMQRVETWEQEAATTQNHSDQGPSESAEFTLTEEVQPEPPDALSNQTRYALLGLLFQSETYLQKGTGTLGRAERAAWKLMTPVHRPLGTWRVFGPARRRYERLVSRGEAEMDRWVKLGRAEARRSRAMVQTAIDSSIDESIEFVTESPQVRGIVRQASTSMSGEIADEVRARSVSSDTLVEGLARRLFRRAPREYPPEPPITLETLENDRTRRD